MVILFCIRPRSSVSLYTNSEQVPSGAILLRGAVYGRLRPSFRAIIYDTEQERMCGVHQDNGPVAQWIRAPVFGTEIIRTERYFAAAQCGIPLYFKSRNS